VLPNWVITSFVGVVGHEALSAEVISACIAKLSLPENELRRPRLVAGANALFAPSHFHRTQTPFWQ
jgi:hypothetical protein